MYLTPFCGTLHSFASDEVGSSGACMDSPTRSSFSPLPVGGDWVVGLSAGVGLGRPSPWLDGDCFLEAPSTDTTVSMAACDVLGLLRRDARVFWSEVSELPFGLRACSCLEGVTACWLGSWGCVKFWPFVSLVCNGALSTAQIKYAERKRRRRFGNNNILTQSLPDCRDLITLHKLLAEDSPNFWISVTAGRWNAVEEGAWWNQAWTWLTSPRTGRLTESWRRPFYPNKLHSHL